MPSDEYWNGRGDLVIGYRAAQERKVNHDNYMLWVQGYYIYYAIGAMSPVLNPMSKKHEPKDYLEKALPLTQSAKEQDEIEKMEKMAQKMMLWARAVHPEVTEAQESGENGDTGR